MNTCIQEHVSKEDLLHSFRIADASTAGCNNPDHRHLLLAIIEHAYGDIRAFNRELRAILTNKVAPSWVSSSVQGIVRQVTREVSSPMQRMQRMLTPGGGVKSSSPDPADVPQDDNSNVLVDIPSQDLPTGDGVGVSAPALLTA